MVTKLRSVNYIDAGLYVDVVCSKCKKCIALSNANQHDGLYYCNQCYEKYFFKLDSLFKKASN